MRYEDGIEAATANRRIAAIYFWGCAAETILKAAYFSAVGFPETRAITFTDLNAAWKAVVTNYGVSWPVQGRLHNVRAWCDLLVAYRSRTPGSMYPQPRFGDDVRRRGKRIEPIWSETLRHHHNIAYEYEVDRMREAVLWLVDHSPLLQR